MQKERLIFIYPNLFTFIQTEIKLLSDDYEIISKKLTFSQKADLYYRVKRLIDKNLMGELFKVMLATKKNVQFKVGFIN